MDISILAETLDKKGRIAVLSEDREYLYIIYEAVMEGEGYQVEKYDVDDLDVLMDGGYINGDATEALGYML